MKNRYSVEQIVTALKQMELGEKTTDVCRKLGMSQATICLWKKKYRGTGVSELLRVKELEEENCELPPIFRQERV